MTEFETKLLEIAKELEESYDDLTPEVDIKYTNKTIIFASKLKYLVGYISALEHKKQ